jgi:hypothetical protein
VCAAAALDQPAVACDLVGSVDRDVEPFELLEGYDVDPELGGDLGCRLRAASAGSR